MGTEREREIRLPTEVADGLGRFVVKDFEVVFFQVGNEFVAAIKHSEKDVDEVDGLRDPALSLLWGRRLLRRRGLCRRRLLNSVLALARCRAGRLLRAVARRGEQQSCRQCH